MTDRASSSVVKDGVTQRVHFTPEHKVLDLPDLVGHLKSSWRQTGRKRPGRGLSGSKSSR